MAEELSSQAAQLADTLTYFKLPSKMLIQTGKTEEQEISKHHEVKFGHASGKGTGNSAGSPVKPKSEGSSKSSAMVARTAIVPIEDAKFEEF